MLKEKVGFSHKTIVLICGLFICLLSAQTSAQQIASIGIGDLRIKGKQPQTISDDPTLVSLRRALNTALDDTRKFTMISYQEMVDQLARQGLNLAGFEDEQYQAAEKDQVGFDYILTANVVEYGVFEQARGANVDKIGLVDLDFKLTGVADITENQASSVSAQSTVRIPAGGSVDEKAILAKALDGAVEKMVADLTASLHPIRVMIIGQDSAITLNYGSGVLKTGDTVWVYPEGFDPNEPAVDPIATLQVIDAGTKFAQAQALEGIDNIERGQVALRSTQQFDVDSLCEEMIADASSEAPRIPLSVCELGSPR